MTQHHKIEAGTQRLKMLQLFMTGNFLFIMLRLGTKNMALCNKIRFKITFGDILGRMAFC